MTLFEAAATIGAGEAAAAGQSKGADGRGAPFSDALAALCGGERDGATLQLLGLS